MELAPGVRALFTGRDGGVSLPPYDSLNLSTRGGDDAAAVAANRAALADRIGRPIVWMNPVHGRDVSISEDPLAEPPVADILLTARADVALAALAADCVTMVAAVPSTRWIAAAHVGREGLRVGAVEALLDTLREASGEASDARTAVAVGPAICGRCYEVSRALHDEVVALHPAAASTTPEGAPALDLVAAITAILAARGVSAVTIDGRCTVEDPALFSYRRDGATGRHAALVWREGA